MKFLHLSDLHLGLSLHRFHLYDEQQQTLGHIRQIAQDHRPDAVIIAGDVYDRSLPGASAMRQLDDFLASLRMLDLPVYVISGNHDSAERVGHLSSALAAGGLYVSPAYRGRVAPIVTEDEHGPVHIYLLPFLKPAVVRAAHPDDPLAECIQTTNDAVAYAIAKMEIDPDVRSVLVAHQFVAGAAVSGGEESIPKDRTGDVIVGTTDLVDAAAFAPFDYVALGHIHRCQNVGSERIHYCGTPMKYSFSEVNHRKTVSMVELDGEGRVHIERIDVPEPIHPLQKLTGSFAELTDPAFYRQTNPKAYTDVTLTDDALVPDAFARLQGYYENLAHLSFQRKAGDDEELAPILGAEKRSMLSVFEEFYAFRNGAPMNEEQRSFMEALISGIEEDEE